MTDKRQVSPSEAQPQRRSWVALVTTVFLFAVLAAAIFIAWRAWTGLSDANISRQGLLALGLGAAALIVGGGLMTLVFISSRRGYDDEAGHD